VSGGPELGAAFAALPFDHLLFTGSTRVGSLVMQAAAANLTPVTLELGGKSSVVIGRDADLGLAARRIVWGKLLNGGQACIAPDYALVPRDRLEHFVQLLQREVARQYPSLGDNPDYTSIISTAQRERLRTDRDRCAAVLQCSVGSSRLGPDVRCFGSTVGDGRNRSFIGLMHDGLRLAPRRHLVQLRYEVLGTQMGVALKHLHALVPTDRGHFLVAQPGLDQTADGLVAQVMKAEIAATH
jgi:hypothetical protein